MELNDLYRFVLLLVLVGMILGVGILVIDKFGGTAGITPNANATLQNVTLALMPIATDWLPLIVTVGVLAIILTLVVRSFAVRTR